MLRITYKIDTFTYLPENRTIIHDISIGILNQKLDIIQAVFLKLKKYKNIYMI